MLIEEIIKEIKSNSSAEFNFKPDDFKHISCSNCKFICNEFLCELREDKVDLDFVCKYFETRE